MTTIQQCDYCKAEQPEYTLMLKKRSGVDVIMGKGGKDVCAKCVAKMGAKQ